MKTVAARKSSAKKPTARKTVTVDLALVLRLEEYFRVIQDEEKYNDRNYRLDEFERLHSRFVRIIRNVEIREAVEADRASRVSPIAEAEAERQIEAIKADVVISRRPENDNAADREAA
jgi:hypothetical protein